jgi:hypothetical protein
MIRQGLSQVITEVPQDAEPIGGMPHELPFGAYPLKKQDELELEEDDGVN